MHWDQKDFKEDQEEQQRLDKVFSSEDQEGESVDASPDKFIGTVVAERYEILELAGKGGMSVVYRAKHILTQKIVALKLMHSYLLSDENAVRRFQIEAKAASRLHHPNAISVQDMGLTGDGQPFITMDYLEGWPLSQVIKSCGKIDPRRAIHIFVQACSAIGHAHEQRIVHRDLKPSNVMLIRSDDDPDFVKVVDFGIAKILPEGGDILKVTATGDVFGSPLYMSPEQCMGHELDARSDIYSMGCLMYEALTGKVPHEGNNALETMYKHTNQAAPMLADIAADPRLVQRLDSIVQKSMAKVPDQRYQSMAALRDDLLDAGLSPQKGSKLAAQLGMGASSKGREFDNRLASISSKKLFWLVAMPLALVSLLGVSFMGYYFYSISGDPKPSDRLLVLNRKFDRQGFDKKQMKRRYTEYDVLMTLHAPRFEDNYATIYRLALFFAEIGDYDRCLEACGNAFTFRSKAGLDVANQSLLEPAQLHSAMAQSYLRKGSLGEAQSWAIRALSEFRSSDVTSDPWVATDYGTILEVYSKSPELLNSATTYLDLMLRPRRSVPIVDGLAYSQATDYALACAEAGIQKVGISTYVEARKRIELGPTDTMTVAEKCVKLANEAWEKLSESDSKTASIYNQGVLFNKLGLYYQKIGNLPKAEENFELAGQKIGEALGHKDDAYAKVLFNYSDVLKSEGKWLDYNQFHSEARRIWSDSAHAK